MSERNHARKTEKVIRRVLKTMEKYDHIGKAEFEEVLRKVVQQVHQNSDGVGHWQVVPYRLEILSLGPWAR